MNGKDKCKFLKGIRKRTAEANGIPYEPKECTYEGDCTGTCSYCEKEAAELMAKIKEKKGDAVKTDTEAIAVLEEVAKKYENHTEPEESLVQGDTDTLSDEELKMLRMQQEKAEIIRIEEEGLMGYIEEPHTKRKSIFSKIKDIMINKFSKFS